MEETKTSIKEEVNQTLDVKTSIISLSTNKSFLAKHLIINSVDDSLKLLKGNQLKQI
jgi:hypothetical protein